MIIEELLIGQGAILIKKYENFYIRFEGGELATRLYDLKIRREEAELILNNKIEMHELLIEYMNSGKCREDMLMIGMADDYLECEEKYSRDESKRTIYKLAQYQDIFTSFINYLVNKKLPDRDVKVENYTAKMLVEKLSISVIEAYIYLVDLRNEPEKYLERLK